VKSHEANKNTQSSLIEYTHLHLIQCDTVLFNKPDKRFDVAPLFFGYSFELGFLFF